MVHPALPVLGSLVALALGVALAGQAGGRPAPADRSLSSATGGVTIYGATWCGPCRHLEATLTQRNVPFVVVDVDQNSDAYAKARTASGMGSGIPLTNIERSTVTWVQGDDADAVERAYKGD